MSGVWKNRLTIEMTVKVPKYAPSKENLVEPYLSINQHQSESIGINQHLVTPIALILCKGLIMTVVASIASMGKSCPNGRSSRGDRSGKEIGETLVNL